MPLTLAQKSDVRRHLGYPLAGIPRTGVAGGTLGQGSINYRWNQGYAFLEYKLNNLMPDDEARLTGLFYGGVALGSGGVTPTVGDGASVTITPSGVAAQTVSAVAAQGDRALNVANKLAAAIALNATLASAQILPVAPYGTGVFAQADGSIIGAPLAEVGLQCPTAFTVTVAAVGTGTIAPFITATGTQLYPQSTVDPSTNPPTVLNGYIPILNFLEGAMAGATQNLDTIQADVWYARPTEVPERIHLYGVWSQRLADFLGVQRFSAQGVQKTMRQVV